MLSQDDLQKIQKLIQDSVSPMFVPIVEELKSQGQRLDRVEETIKNSPTREDFVGLEVRIEVVKDSIKYLPTRKDLVGLEISIDEIKESITHLPTKDEFYERELEIYGELKVVRESQEIQSGYKEQISSLEDRVERLETVV